MEFLFDHTLLLLTRIAYVYNNHEMPEMLELYYQRTELALTYPSHKSEPERMAGKWNLGLYCTRCICTRPPVCFLP